MCEREATISMRIWFGGAFLSRLFRAQRLPGLKGVQCAVFIMFIIVKCNAKPNPPIAIVVP